MSINNILPNEPSELLSESPIVDQALPTIQHLPIPLPYRHSIRPRNKPSRLKKLCLITALPENQSKPAHISSKGGYYDERKVRLRLLLLSLYTSPTYPFTKPSTFYDSYMSF